MEQAAQSFAQLPQADPAAALPSLAAAFGNIGAQLAGLGRYQDALAPTEQSVAIVRRLTQADPGPHLAELARALHGYALVRAMGEIDLENARAAIEESAAIYQPLAERLPAAFDSDLRAVQSTQAVIHDALSRTAARWSVRKRSGRIRVAFHAAMASSDSGKRLNREDHV